jgi:hypothetical protein
MKGSQAVQSKINNDKKIILRKILRRILHYGKISGKLMSFAKAKTFLILIVNFAIVYQSKKYLCCRVNVTL